jgi:hypothetical protein
MSCDNKKRSTKADWLTQLELAFSSNPPANNVVADHIRAHYHIIPNDGAGDCLFLALSQCMYGDTSMNGCIRQETCDYIETNADEFKDFQDEDFDEITKEVNGEMSCYSTTQYGNHFNIIAASKLYSIDVWVGDQDAAVFTRASDVSIKATAVVWLKLQNQHYEAYVLSVSMNDSDEMLKSNNLTVEDVTNVIELALAEDAKLNAPATVGPPVNATSLASSQNSSLSLASQIAPAIINLIGNAAGIDSIEASFNQAVNTTLSTLSANTIQGLKGLIRRYWNQPNGTTHQPTREEIESEVEQIINESNPDENDDDATPSVAPGTTPPTTPADPASPISAPANAVDDDAADDFFDAQQGDAAAPDDNDPLNATQADSLNSTGGTVDAAATSPATPVSPATAVVPRTQTSISQMVADFESYLTADSPDKNVAVYRALLQRRPAWGSLDLFKYRAWRREHDAVLGEIKKKVPSLIRFNPLDELTTTEIASSVLFPQEPTLSLKILNAVYTGLGKPGSGVTGMVQLFNAPALPVNVQKLVVDVVNVIMLPPEVADLDSVEGSYTITDTGLIAPVKGHTSPPWSPARFKQLVGWTKADEPHVTVAMVVHDFATNALSLTAENVRALGNLNYTTQDVPTLSLDEAGGQQLVRAEILRASLSCASHVLNNPGTVVEQGRADMCAVGIRMLRSTDAELKSSLYEILSSTQENPTEHAHALRTQHAQATIKPLWLSDDNTYSTTPPPVPVDTAAGVAPRESYDAFVSAPLGYDVASLSQNATTEDFTVTFTNTATKNTTEPVESNIKAIIEIVNAETAGRFQTTQNAPPGWSEKALQMLKDNAPSRTLTAGVCVLLASLAATSWAYKAEKARRAANPRPKPTDLRTAIRRLARSHASGFSIARILAFDNFWTRGTAPDVRARASRRILDLAAEGAAAPPSPPPPSPPPPPDTITTVLLSAITDARSLRDKIGRLEKLMRHDYENV